MWRGHVFPEMTLVIALLSLVLVTDARAQVCFRGQPRPRCAGFTVLEFGAGARLNQVSTPLDPYFSGNSSIYASWSAGYLENLGPQSALGAAFMVAANDDGVRYGPVLRYRRWLGPTWSVDLSPGLLVGGHDNYKSLKFPSLTADVTLNWGDRLGILAGIDQLRTGNGNNGWEGHAGLRFGTWLAPLGVLALGILAGASYN